MIKAYNLLGLMQRAGKLITGEDLITKNLKNNKIKLLVIAEDNRVAVGITDDGFIKKFKQLLEEGGKQ